MNFKSIRFKILLLLLVFIFLSVGAIYYGIYSPANKNSREIKDFIIEKGQSARAIAANLKSEGLINGEYYFLVYGFLRNQAKKIQAGEYQLSPSMNIPRIFSAITTRRSQTVKFKIIEGWTQNDIGAKLQEQNIFSKSKFLSFVKNPPKEFLDNFEFLKNNRVISLEGYLYPDTYFIDKSEGIEIFVRKVLENFKKQILDVYQGAISDLQYSAHNILALASILEKEAASKDDKRIIAGIFLKRLKYNIPLESDATIHYLKNDFKSDISLLDLKIDSRYNTYKYIGLPPGPISNPGLESIEAALYPKESSYWFFLADQKGNIHFSETFFEHAIKREKLLN